MIDFENGIYNIYFKRENVLEKNVKCEYNSKYNGIYCEKNNNENWVIELDYKNIYYNSIEDVLVVD